jgi:hypothetical protein
MEEVEGRLRAVYLQHKAGAESSNRKCLEESLKAYCAGFQDIFQGSTVIPDSQLLERHKNKKHEIYREFVLDKRRDGNKELLISFEQELDEALNSKHEQFLMRNQNNRLEEESLCKKQLQLCLQTFKEAVEAHKQKGISDAEQWTQTLEKHEAKALEMFRKDNRFSTPEIKEECFEMLEMKLSKAKLSCVQEFLQKEQDTRKRVKEMGGKLSNEFASQMQIFMDRNPWMAEEDLAAFVERERPKVLQEFSSQAEEFPDEIKESVLEKLEKTLGDTATNLRTQHTLKVRIGLLLIYYKCANRLFIFSKK